MIKSQQTGPDLRNVIINLHSHFRGFYKSPPHSAFHIWVEMLCSLETSGAWHLLCLLSVQISQRPLPWWHTSAYPVVQVQWMGQWQEAFGIYASFITRKRFDSTKQSFHVNAWDLNGVCLLKVLILPFTQQRKRMVREESCLIMRRRKISGRRTRRWEAPLSFIYAPQSFVWYYISNV